MFIFLKGAVSAKATWSTCDKKRGQWRGEIVRQGWRTPWNTWRLCSTTSFFSSWSEIKKLERSEITEPKCVKLGWNRFPKSHPSIQFAWFRLSSSRVFTKSKPFFHNNSRSVSPGVDIFLVKFSDRILQKAKHFNFATSSDQLLVSLNPNRLSHRRRLWDTFDTSDACVVGINDTF